MANKKEYGFTLIEIVVVLGLVGILTAIATPAFLSWLPDMRLKSASRDLYSNLQSAKLQAVKNNRRVSVRFNTVANPGFYYFDMDNNAAFTPGEFRVNLSDFPDVTFGSGNATTDSNGATIVQASIITFSSNGTANPGTLFLANIQNPARCFSITTQTSGSVHIREYSGTWTK